MKNDAYENFYKSYKHKLLHIQPVECYVSNTNLKSEVFLFLISYYAKPLARIISETVLYHRR